MSDSEKTIELLQQEISVWKGMRDYWVGHDLFKEGTSDEWGIDEWGIRDEHGFRKYGLCHTIGKLTPVDLWGGPVGLMVQRRLEAMVVRVHGLFIKTKLRQHRKPWSTAYAWPLNHKGKKQRIKYCNGQIARCRREIREIKEDIIDEDRCSCGSLDCDVNRGGE